MSIFLKKWVLESQKIYFKKVDVISQKHLGTPLLDIFKPLGGYSWFLRLSQKNSNK